MGKSRLSLSDAIKHCEEVALQKDTEAEEHNPRYTGLIRECKECAAEHRQLAEWLKELKERREKDVPDTNVEDMVSRAAAIDAIVNTVSEIGLHDNSEVARYGATFRQHEIIDIIEGMPSAQPERKTGKWIMHPEVRNYCGGTCIECSECGEKYMVRHVEDEKFCRSCGADMRG